MHFKLPSPLVRLAVLIPALCLALAACSGEGEEKGVVARVNNQPIYLNELESKYDMMVANWAASDSPSLERLKQDYGMILGDLIVQALVHQALEAKGLGVTEEELEAAEAVVRADYDDQEVFEQVLVEEYIDLAYWRHELKARLEMKKFFNEVLRPKVTLNYQEAEAYYRSNISDFYLPPRVELVVIRGPSRDAVASAADQYTVEGDAEKLASRFKELTVERVKIREDRLAMDWKNAISGLKPGEAGPVMSEDRAFTCLVFLDKSPAHVLEPSRAYPIVERVLLEKKLREEFERWLTEELNLARIEINPQLDMETLIAAQRENEAEGIEEPLEDLDVPGPEVEQDGVESVQGEVPVDTGVEGDVEMPASEIEKDRLEEKGLYEETEQPGKGQDKAKP